MPLPVHNDHKHTTAHALAWPGGVGPLFRLAKAGALPRLKVRTAAEEGDEDSDRCTEPPAEVQKFLNGDFKDAKKS